MVRVARLSAGLLLVASGALMYAASWQRWSGACAWGRESGRCDQLQDHRFDFVLPREPWEPVGVAAQLAGSSMLLLALVLPLLPLALTGRRPHLVMSAASAAVAVGVADLGLATLRSGLAGQVVDLLSGPLAAASFVLLPVLLMVLAVTSRRWSMAAALLLFVATPLVAAFSYAIGPYDTQPWWEAVSGVFTAAGGLCLLVAAFRGAPRADDGASAASPIGTAAEPANPS